MMSWYRVQYLSLSIDFIESSKGEWFQSIHLIVDYLTLVANEKPFSSSSLRLTANHKHHIANHTTQPQQLLN